MKVLVLGSNGMLGFALHRVLHDAGHEVHGSLRNDAAPPSPWCHGLRYVGNVDVHDFNSVRSVLDLLQPELIVNAAGVIKQVAGARDHDRLIAINAVFPRLLDIDARHRGTRVLHFSTDCVFSGRKGMYTEDDLPDAGDMYGMSKFLGEAPSEHTLVLRTSIIGRGLSPNGSLVDWFLSQAGTVKGFSRAFFSGLPVNEIADVVHRHVLPQMESMAGLYHLSAQPIDKYALLDLVRNAWSKTDVHLESDASFVIDRSLNSTRFREKCRYQPPAWPALVESMRNFYAQFSA